MKKTIIFLLMISIVLSIFADNIIFEEEKDTLEIQDNSKAKTDMDAYYQGHIDGANIAKADKVWFFVGCFMGIWGLVIPYLVSYEPDSKIIGDVFSEKNNAYIMGFKEGYSQKKKTLNMKQGLYGFITYIITVGILYIAYIILIISMFP